MELFVPDRDTLTCALTLDHLMECFLPFGNKLACTLALDELLGTSCPNELLGTSCPKETKETCMSALDEPGGCF